jgi:drug/metabolite transporter (DMT)-like permease
VLLGVALGGERLPKLAWVAMTVIVGGVAMVSLVDARRRATA